MCSLLTFTRQEEVMFQDFVLDFFLQYSEVREYFLGLFLFFLIVGLTKTRVFLEGGS